MNPTAFESIKLQSEIDYLFSKSNCSLEKSIKDIKKSIAEAISASGAIQKLAKAAREIKERISDL